MEKENQTIKLSKNTIYLIAIIIIAIIALLIFYNKSTKTQVEIPENIDDINYYKKALFDSTVCQYSCPLEEQPFQGTQQLLPSKECIRSCIDELKANGFNENTTTQYNILLDPMVSDVESAIVNCRIENTINDKINNEGFFTCSAEKLELLRGEYEYLN